MIKGTLSGWLTGIDIEGNKATLMFRDSDKRMLVKDEYHPYFYALLRLRSDPAKDVSEDAGANTGCSAWPYRNGGGAGTFYAKMARRIIVQHPNVIDARIEKRRTSLLNNGKEEVVRIFVDSVYNFKKVCSDMKKVPHIREIAETNVPHYFRYMMDKDLKFFSKYEASVGTNGKAISITKLDYDTVPQLKLASVSCFGPSANVLMDDGSEYCMDAGMLPGFVSDNGIDVLFSYNGDDFLSKIKNRNVSSSPAGCFLKGCTHIDLRRDMQADIYNDRNNVNADRASGITEWLLSTGKERMARVMELSHMSGARPDIVCRVSPGRLNSFLHMKAARKKHYIIPDTKKSMENPKSLWMLAIVDKGGLILYPKIGVYKNVAKCDFASMYPNIIVKYNISPETVNCSCCDNDDNITPVPDTDWHICSKHNGIIARGIKDVLNRRLSIKKQMKTEKGPISMKNLDLRQKALKNILVCSFGYLGFRNFVFSNVECKECVMLFGRHILMRTKEMAEEHGLTVIYGITDSVFVKDGTKKLYRKFSRAVTKEIGIELEIDCTFKAIAFPAARDGSGIANKYYGIKEDDEIEARGIGLRHSDCPRLVKNFQEKAIRLMLCDDYDFLTGKQKASELLEAFKSMVSAGNLEMDDLAITKKMRRPIESYVSNAPHIVAYRHLSDCARKGDQTQNSPIGISTIPVTSSGAARPARSPLQLHKPSVTYVWARTGPRPVQSVSAEEIDAHRYGELLTDSFEEMTRGVLA